MPNPTPTNPNPKPQDDKKQGGRDPLGQVLDPGKGQGRDPIKDPDRQRGGETDQRKQGGGQDTRKPT